MVFNNFCCVIIINMTYNQKLGGLSRLIDMVILENSMRKELKEFIGKPINEDTTRQMQSIVIRKLQEFGIDDDFEFNIPFDDGKFNYKVVVNKESITSERYNKGTLVEIVVWK